MLNLLSRCLSQDVRLIVSGLNVREVALMLERKNQGGNIDDE